ncbi:unnamed protein product [Symbiodinium sp. CCMP2592]|nr:unnamed protein product [Symbiodinium sp. CCMP2592]
MAVVIGDSPPAPRRARRVTSAWSAEPAAAVEDLKEFRKEARRLPEAGVVETGDLVVVVEPSRSWHGRVCMTVFADAGATLWLKKVEDVELSLNKLSAEVCTLPKRGRETEAKALKRRDVVRLPWPGLRRPPPPMTEQHYMAQDWDKLSDKRFSPGRLSATWDNMDAPSRRKYRGASVAAIEVYQQVAQWRHRMHALLKELLDVAPKPQVNAYMLYTMEKSKKPAEPLPPWQDVKEEPRNIRSLSCGGINSCSSAPEFYPHVVQLVLELCSRCEKLRVLKLYKNDINDDGAQALSRFVRKCYTLEELHLSHNRFTERGVELLVRAAEEARTQAKSSVPMWTRLEQNEVKNPDKVLEYLEKEYSALELSLWQEAPRPVLDKALSLRGQGLLINRDLKRDIVIGLSVLESVARGAESGPSEASPARASGCQALRDGEEEDRLSTAAPSLCDDREDATTRWADVADVDCNFLSAEKAPQSRRWADLCDSDESDDEQDQAQSSSAPPRESQGESKVSSPAKPRWADLAEDLDQQETTASTSSHAVTQSPQASEDEGWGYKSSKWWKNSRADDSKATSSAAAYDYDYGAYGRKSQWRPAGESYSQAQGHRQTWWSGGGWQYEKPSYAPKGKGKGKAAGKGGGKASSKGGGGGGGGSKCQCQYIIGIEEEGRFRVCRRLLGQKGQHMKDIAEKTGAKLRLRGRGSKFLEGPEQKESSDPLMLCVSVPDPASYEEAKHLVSSLLEDIYVQYREFQLSEGLKPKNLQVNLHEGTVPVNCACITDLPAEHLRGEGHSTSAEYGNSLAAMCAPEGFTFRTFIFSEMPEFGQANNDGPRKRKWAPPPEPVEDTDPWKDTDWREGRDDWFDGCPEAFRKVPEWEEPAKKKWRTEEEEDWDGTGEPRPSGVKMSGGIFMRAMGAIVAKKDDDDGARPENEPSKPSRPPRVPNNVASRTLSQLGVLAGERRKAKVLLKEAPRGPVKKEATWSVCRMRCQMPTFHQHAGNTALDSRGHLCKVLRCQG